MSFCFTKTIHWLKILISHFILHKPSYNSCVLLIGREPMPPAGWCGHDQAEWGCGGGTQQQNGGTEHGRWYLLRDELRDWRMAAIQEVQTNGMKSYVSLRIWKCWIHRGPIMFETSNITPRWILRWTIWLANGADNQWHEVIHLVTHLEKLNRLRPGYIEIMFKGALTCT